MGNIININSGMSTAFARSEGYTSYTNDVRKYKVLSQEEEQVLLAEYLETKSESRKIEIRNILICANQRFIIAAAKQYAQRDTELFLNLIGEANIAFAEAIEKYDPSKMNKKDGKLCSWAAWFVRRNINIYLYQNNSMVRQTNNSLTHFRLAKIRSTLSQQLEREPTDEEVAEYLRNEHGVDIQNASDVTSIRVSSVDFIKDDDDSFNPTFAAFNDLTASNNNSEREEEKDYAHTLIKLGMACLSEKERQVIQMLYGLNGEFLEASTDTVAKKLGYTTERIRQIHVAALKKMASKIRLKGANA